MAIKFEKIEPGMVLLDVRRHKMGNTMMSEWGAWQVRIISVDRENRTAVVSWNGNRHETWYERQLSRLYGKEPKCVRDQRERRKKGYWA
jgi:hypothetical protein